MFNKLVKNELTKQFKKKGIVIFTALILLLSVVSPVIIKYIDDKSIEDVDMSVTGYNMEFIEEELAKPVTTVAEKANHLVHTGRKNNLLMIQQLTLVDNDWRAPLIDLHERTAINSEYVNAMIDGMTFEEIKLHGDSFDYNLLESLADASTEQLTEAYNNLNAEMSNYAEIMINSDYVAGTEIFIQMNEEVIAIKEIELEELYEQPQDDFVISDIQFTEQLIKRLETENEILQMRIDMGIPYDDYDWKSQTLDSMVFYNNGINEIIMSEGEFSVYGFSNADTYEEYVTLANLKIDTRKDRLSELYHSLEVGEPAYELMVDARVSTNTSLEISVIAITTLLIFMGCGIMSSEFSKGTIRMLVARPVKRSSIFFAKLTSLVIVGLGLVIVSAVISTITSGIIFGFSDFGIDVAKSSGDILSTYNYFYFLASEIVVTLGGMALVIALLITLSTITRSAIFSLGFTMLLYMLSAPIGAFFISSELVRNSILPYMNVGMIRLVPDLYNSVWGMGYDLNLTLGAISMLALAAVISTVGCIVFVKKDIRN